MKQVEAFLRSDDSPGDESQRRDLRFHLAMWLVARAKKARVTKLSKLGKIVGKQFSDKELKAAMTELVDLLSKYPEKASPIDTIAKTREFVRYLFKQKFAVEW